MDSKVAYIFPGFKLSAKSIEYGKISEFFENKGIKSIIVDISWQRKTVSEYANDFLSKYYDNKYKEVYLLGFSFGAMAALIVASKINAKKLILCSTSPYFKEHYETIDNDEKRYFGKKRMADFLKISLKELLKKIKCKTFVLYGEKEHECIIKNSEYIAKRLNCSIKAAKDTKHEFSDNYLNLVKSII